MSDPQIATRTQLWQCGGIISEVAWEHEAAELLMWDGSEQTIHPGDKVLILQRGLPMAHFVAIERA